MQDVISNVFHNMQIYNSKCNITHNKNTIYVRIIQLDDDKNLTFQILQSKTSALKHNSVNVRGFDQDLYLWQEYVMDHLVLNLSKYYTSLTNKI